MKRLDAYDALLTVADRIRVAELALRSYDDVIERDEAFAISNLLFEQRKLLVAAAEALSPSTRATVAA